MTLSEAQIQAWKAAKAHLLLPIVYVRGFAMTGGEIEDTSADPFNGFNVGSTLLRTGWTGEAARHVFESPVLRLSQPPYGYRVAFSDGIRGLNAETKHALRDWRRVAEPAAPGVPARPAPALPGERPPPAVLAIYRYYDAASHAFGGGVRPGMETYGWGLGRLVADLLDVTEAPGVYIVAHSMGGLVARTFLQNEAVLDGSTGATRDRCGAVAALLEADEGLRVAQADWSRARAAVRRLFTYGTPHYGITAQGGIGNGLLGPVDALLGLELENFSRDRMVEYLGGPPAANSLDGRFPVRDAFCLVGTAAADYPAAGGFSRRLVGQLSDGLVEVDNAVVHGPAGPDDPDPPGGTVLAARAYVRHAHSGPYGMVNSEEGFGSLSRFLYGDLRVDSDLIVRDVELPAALVDEQAKGSKIRASYGFEVFLRVRGARWALTERLARDGTAAFRRYDELFPEKAPGPDLAMTEARLRDRERHRRLELFSAFLDTAMRTLDGEPDVVGGRELPGTLGFALRLRVAVPDYEVAGRLWRKTHYEGSALLDQDLVFLAYEDQDQPGGWNLAWGPNRADGKNAQMQIVAAETDAEPAAVAGPALRRVLPSGAIEFWVPVVEGGPPAFRAWLRLTARGWNTGSRHRPDPGFPSAAPAPTLGRAHGGAEEGARMRFGLFGGARTKRSVGLGDSQGYDAFVAYVQEAERLGFHNLFMVEHHFTGQGQVSASMTLLAYLAAKTRRIRLGTAVVVLPWHNPVLVAEQAATLDLLSGGRFDFGVGKGYRAAEFAGFCIPPGEAGERFDEAIEVIRKAWTSEGRFSHHGKRWRYEDVVVEPAPVQRPHPPLWMAAGSEESIRRAAREGFNLLLDQLASVAQITERVAIFREACEAAGRTWDPHRVAVARALQMIRTEEERAAAFETRRRVLGTIGDLHRGERAASVEADDAPLLGTAEEIVARIRRLEAGGVATILLVDPNASVGNLRAFAEDVMPAFATRPAAAAAE